MSPTVLDVIRLDAATVMLQWSVGGLFFLWITARRRSVGLGYGWLLRGIYGMFAIGAAVVGIAFDTVIVRDVASVLVAFAAAAAFGV